MYVASFDVRLTKNLGQAAQEIQTVVQPDISVICDALKLDEAGGIGAPDLIVEILSNSTAKKDYNEKFNLYEENGVKEYWIAKPATMTLEVYTLEENRYQLHGLFDKKNGDEQATGKLFPGLRIALAQVFKD